MTKRGKTAIIIGAGPAGLTAAYEFLQSTDIKPVVFETGNQVGGISKTINYKGNRMDLGGHRFFTKSDRVLKWWFDLMPLQGYPARDYKALNREGLLSKKKNSPDPEKTDHVMLIRNRLSRIYFLKKFFNYPVTLSLDTLLNLGLFRVVRILFSYALVKITPIKKEKSLEDFFINRFGRELYKTFFKDYTEKLWGIRCDQIDPEFGIQRVKGVSMKETLVNALRSIVGRKKGLLEKKQESSLIEHFFYPKLGPGSLWENVADIISASGGKIKFDKKIISMSIGKKVLVRTRSSDGVEEEFTGDYLISSMPIKDLVNSLETNVPDQVKTLANGLIYRDFISIGLLVNKLKTKNRTKVRTVGNIIPDNWIYVQDREVKMGRIQIFNNWSPYMIKNPETVWLGLEYFCNEGDNFWKKNNKEISQHAIDELVKMGMIENGSVLDWTVVKVPKAYPAYFGTYDRFNIVKEYLDKFENLFLIGRNGMHRYNNMDHSMLTAMKAVENIKNGVVKKDNIWSVNAEQEYSEEK